MTISLTEENYLKAIYTLSRLGDESEVTTNEISKHLKNKAATVTDMLKRLAEKKLINYIPYQGVKLTEKGKRTAIKVVRKHRLWEVFLVDKLNFKWDEVHEIAEQLEHINSDELIQRLDVFLGKPKFDPHGDPIPDANGQLNTIKALPLNQRKSKGNFIFVGVNEHSKSFLQHLTGIGLKIGDSLLIEEINEFDNSFKVKINKTNSQFFSNKVASNILVEIKK
ncbi:MAG: metal-dependent transcriptional regulator [Bacteroidota bacterium]|nr:metal-dependent transcriptional regulator [Bacteroidota bacterium]MDP3146209.1 metal-dependent transcriptional regulator [Bacteroidota bacterium]